MGNLNRCPGRFFNICMMESRKPPMSFVRETTYYPCRGMEDVLVKSLKCNDLSKDMRELLPQNWKTLANL